MQLQVTLALLLCSCAAATSDQRVMLLDQDGLRCTAAAIAPLRALTAAHCVVPPGSTVTLDGEPARDTRLWEPGIDIASLHPSSPFEAFFEYATRVPERGERLLLIGYGCADRQMTRELRYLEPGLADGEACHGDSGGPLLNEQGELVGIFSGWTNDGRLRFVQITKQSD